MRKNKNRGYQKLRVWNDAIEYYQQTFYKLENGLLKLVESLERKRASGDWTDHLVVKESYAAYGSD